MTLGKIALAFSGGGYRASGFHLGTLECLDRLGLLDDVKVLSTISGGTFTGAAYALSRTRRTSFSEFRDTFALDLQKLNVIEQALGRLVESRESAVNASLICAAARVYDDVLFKNAYFGELFGGVVFDDLAFNATEFVYGLSFRFAVSSSGAVIGNKYFKVPPAAAEKIRIADIVAASSCFPGGFEPILFPDQFRFKDGLIPGELKTKEFEKPVPLMDGGIYDNQGISSVLLALKRNPQAFDLLLISDTDQSGDEIYRDMGSSRNGVVKVWHALLLLKLTFVLSLVSSGALLWSLYADWKGFESLFVQIIPLVTMLLAAAGIGYGWLRWRQVRNGLDPVLANVLLRDLGRISLPELGVFARNRVLSVLAMALSIFLKRIRDLCRSEAQQLQAENPRPTDRDPEANSGDSDAEQRGNRFVVETRIVKIPGQGKLAAFKPVVSWLTPTPEMLKVTELAKQVGTQLWFNSTEQDGPERTMRALRLSGEITLCASVLQHLLRDRQEPGGTPDTPRFTPELEALFQKARQYWKVDLAERARTFS